MNRPGCLAMLAFAASLGAASAATPREFRFFKDLQPPTQGARALGAVTLDDDVYAATAAGYPDLRIFDQAGQEIPFLLHARTEKRTEIAEVRVPLRILALRELPENRIEVTLAREPEAAVPAVAELVTRQRDFEKAVSLWGSPDRTNWTLLADASPIFDYSRFMDVRHCRVAFEPRAFAYYKVEIAKISEAHRSPWAEMAKETRQGTAVSEQERVVVWTENLRIEELRFFEKREVRVDRKEVARVCAVTLSPPVTDPVQKVTRVAVHTARQELTSFTLVTPEPCFARTVMVEATDDADGRQRWQAVGRSAITRFHAGPFHQESTTVPLDRPERFPWYRLTVHNLDSPPLAISGVIATGRVQEVVFLSPPAARGRLYYGGEGVAQPAYDIGAISASILNAEFSEWSAGAAVPNPAFHGSRATFGGKALLVAAVLLMVAVLGWVIAKSSRHVAELP